MRRSSRLNLKVLQSDEAYKKLVQEKTAPQLKKGDTENGKSHESLNNIEPSIKRCRRSSRNPDNEAVAGSYEPSKSEDFKFEKENECTYGDKVIQKEGDKPELIPVPEEVSFSDKIANNEDVEAECCISQNLDSPVCHLACVSDNGHIDKANGNGSDNNELSEQSSASDVDVNMAVVVNFVKSAEPNEINIPKEKEKRKSSGKLRRFGNTESDTVALQNSCLDIVSLPAVVVADVEEVGESPAKHANSDAIIVVDGGNNIEESVPVMEEEILNANPKKVKSFCLDRSKYENFNKLSSNPLMQTLLELKKNFPFKDQVKGIYKDSKTCSLKNDINLDGITLQKDTPVDKNDFSKLSSSIQTKAPSVYFDVSAPTPNAANTNKNVEKLMKMSVLPDDLEKMEKTPKLYESKNSTKLKRKKEREETAGKGWYNLPKTEMTEKIKNDLQVIKMRNVLDSKHHYKRNDTNKLPKYFQMGTVVAGAHEFYSSRVPKKQRKRTMVDELLDDAEYRRKNKKKYIEIRKKQLSGGKGFYKKLKNKKKATWERN